MPDTLDRLLPQTQCTQCGYSGCLPYAKAMLAGETANRCVPGGQPLADALAAQLDRPYLPVLQGRFPLDQTGRPPVMLARIREADCIGCTKCLAACPVDAIVGARKYMHSIIDDWCTGCELCLPPCPVDCIDLIPAAQPLPAADQLRLRYQEHQQRFGQLARKQLPDHPSRLSSSMEPTVSPVKNAAHAQDSAPGNVQTRTQGIPHHEPVLHTPDSYEPDLHKPITADTAAVESLLASVSHLPLIIRQSTLRSQLKRLQKLTVIDQATQDAMRHLASALRQLAGQTL